MKYNKALSIHVKLMLLVILFVGVFLRFFLLGDVPKSLNWDEVSWGYNAYSLATTGHDEHGVSYPLSFEAFGDFKQPMYMYLDALPMALWGLSAFAVRFPSALFGSLTILSVFFLTYELFFKSKYRNQLALLTMFLFAVSPWSIQFSRVAFEANIGIFFTITGIYTFLVGLRLKKTWLLILASIIISLSCYTYHSQKIFTPLFFFILLWYGRDYLLKQKSLVFLLIGVFFLMNSIWLIDMRTTSRGRSVMFTEQWKDIIGDSPKLIVDDKENGKVLGQVVHNRRIILGDKYIEQYLSHFNLNFLFVTGDNPRHHPPFMGLLYVVSLPFIIIGMISILKREKRVAQLLFPWLLLAPVASSLAINAPNASRSMVFLPTWEIFAAFGIIMTITSIANIPRRKLVIAAIAGLYFVQILFFSFTYFAHTDTEAALDWQYGYKEAVVWAREAEKKQPVVFSPDFEQGYIFYLFHNAVQPKDYHGKEKVSDECVRIENAYFGKCLQDVHAGYVVTNKSPDSSLITKPVQTITTPGGETAISIYSFIKDPAVSETVPGH